jgi:putative OPT family oligopeptide transporter
MDLFQRAPGDDEQVQRGGPLRTPPDQLVSIDEQHWYEQVFRGDSEPQLTLRAVLMGSVLGFLMALTNVYIGLKAGWHLGVSITASILAYASWGLLQKLGIARTRLSMLETNCLQSTASAAGYSTGNALISAIPALLLLSVSSSAPNGEHLPLWTTIGFVFLVGVLGTVLAIPLKRNLINRERLRFPTGVAAAATLHSLASQGNESIKKARVLLQAGVLGALVPLLKDLTFLGTADKTGKIAREALLPGASKVFDVLPKISIAGKSYALSDFTIKLDHGVALVAAGAIIGLRVSFWMVASGLVLALWITPLGMTSSFSNAAGALVFAVSKPGSAWKEVGLWIGAPILVASSLLSFVLSAGAIMRALRSLRGSDEQVTPALASQIARTEVPRSWFIAGVLVAGIPLLLLVRSAFAIPLHYGLLALAMTSVLCLVVSRTTGEADVTPTGAMGKIMQLTYGVLIPQSPTTNLMTAGITSGAAAASADLLTDLKAGYLLGAHPRRQFIAQALGVFSGAIASVLGFRLLVPDARVLTGSEGHDPMFAAPGAQQWKAVAEVFRVGLGNFHPFARQCIVVGLCVGALLALVERFAPERIRRFMPSATGVGLGFILPFYYPLAMFLGASLAFIAERIDKAWAEQNVLTIAAGLIAGESLMGVLVAALNTFVFV